MPLLSKDERQSILDRMNLHESLREHFTGNKFMGIKCKLCNWTSNALTVSEAIRLNKIHEDTHPETKQINDSMISATEIMSSLHDHECVMGFCNCKCGCHSGPFCTTIMGPLCGNCMIKDSREDRNHGEREEKEKKKQK